jgi:DNA-binding transcriptional MerR regulator
MIEISEKEYSIGEVAGVLHEEIHNIRYWQRELELPDHRNEMNQRVYTQTDINTFKFIKDLRENENLSLKAIKKILQKADIVRDETAVATEAVVPAGNNNYTAIINRLKEDLLGEVSRAVEAGSIEIKSEIEGLKEKIDYLEDERNRKLDEFIEEWRDRNRKKGFLERVFNK